MNQKRQDKDREKKKMEENIYGFMVKESSVGKTDIDRLLH